MLRAKGWWGRQVMKDPLTGKMREVHLGSVRRLQTIYDTNLRTSLSAGSWAQVQRTKQILPYLRYVDPDPHPRPEHLDWSGTVLRADDPWWETHYPPNGWNCKCYADSLGDKDLDRGKYQLRAAAPTSPTYTYENPRTGARSEIPVGIDPGFANNPGIEGIKYSAEKALAEKLASAAPAIARAVEQLARPAARNPTHLDELKAKWDAAPEKTKRLRAALEKRRGAKSIIRHLAPDELQALFEYTGYSGTFNSHLRQGLPMTDHELALLRALNSLPEHPGITFRGLSLTHEEALARYRTGEVITFDKAFASTSRSRVKAGGFSGKGGVILEIRGTTGRHISPISQFPTEREVLFAPMRQMRVKSVEQVGRRIYVVLEEVE